MSEKNHKYCCPVISKLQTYLRSVETNLAVARYQKKANRPTFSLEIKRSYPRMPSIIKN